MPHMMHAQIHADIHTLYACKLQLLYIQFAVLYTELQNPVADRQTEQRHRLNALQPCEPAQACFNNRHTCDQPTTSNIQQLLFCYY